MKPASIRSSLFVALLAVTFAHATPTTYLYDGDTLPTAGSYAGWFTTLGPGHPQGIYFPATSWSSDGDVLTMNTAPGQGIWFGRTGGYGDPSNFSLANTSDGNLVSTRLALTPGSTEWELYWYDGSGYGSSLYFLNGGFQYHTAAGSTFVATDMTQFHTFTSYILAGQVSYFFDNTYLGGGAALTGASDFLLVGDGSGSTPTGIGSMKVDHLKIITAVGSDAPSIAGGPANNVPDAGGTASLLFAAALGLAAVRRVRPAG